MPTRDKLSRRVMDTLILHPTVKEALRRADPQGAVVAYQRATNDAPDHVKDMDTDALAGELRMLFGGQWIVRPDERWRSSMDIVSHRQVSVTYASKARRMITDRLRDAGQVVYV